MYAVYVDAVKSINEKIDDLISFLLHSPDFPSPVLRDSADPEVALDDVLVDFMMDQQLSAKVARGFVVGVYLRQTIFRTLHKSFFEGRFFYGVGSEIYGQFLDAIMSKLESEGTDLLFCF